ncbi:hypothetical protein C8Q70DRAFT_935689 [Cubamyces menziesii]|nr:hypothetical protein C8Q70DRAFT_935689 [Cubamyces menziesii]
MNTHSAPNPSLPAKRRTLRSPPPKPKFISRPPPLPRVQVPMLGNGRHVEPERVQIPKLTTHWGEYQLISLEEAQKRDEIVHPSFDDERAQLKTSDGGLSWPDRERARAEGNKAQEQLDSWTGVGEVGGGLGSPYDVSLPDNAKYSILSSRGIGSSATLDLYSRKTSG